jgi:hypothetical protein
MQFLISWDVAEDNRDAANARFLETGAPPPEGVTMVGRWHLAEGREGFLIAETDDAIALAKWTNQWTDLLTFRVVPIVDDEGVQQVLGG